ncbi:hypothetical protein AWZ03_013842 [Drosophila navojoa]|uniref:Protein cup n=1 Tax=Drosophila navojoa TaxID=7232 RepID=A0A484ATM2_DRONA|nr:protein cup isoform X2 [Drosophila navojoa]TDG39738.1 hypothetical protein AWZ03_013842 [Drosophila navojoa]
MDITKDQSRYSRSDLLALRFEGSARQRPNCANRADLQTLSFWKSNGAQLNVSSNSCGNKSGLSLEVESTSLTNSNGLLSSRRALRNRERAHNYYQRFSSGDQIAGEELQQPSSLGSTTINLCGTSTYKPNIDHRSISSAHLMPAFAKKRFVVEQAEAQHEDGTAIESSASVAVSTQSNVDLKGHSEVRTISRASKTMAVLSPDWERGEKHLSSPHNEQSMSPTAFLAGRQVGNSLNLQERRIGSGRLLPRNDNWEYTKNKEAENLLSNLDKERPQNGNLTSQNQPQQQQHQRLRTSSGKHIDSLIDRDRDRERERRKAVDNHRDQNDGKKNVQSGRSRTATNKDKFNFGDCYSGAMQNRGKRMNLYPAHEPEWFSAGPTSQHETIDLHGFDDYESESSSADLKNITVDICRESDIKPTKPPSRSSSLASLNNNNKNDTEEQHAATNNEQLNCSVNSVQKSDVEFNFDAYLNMDPMDHALMGNDSEVHGDVQSTSRFSQWFACKEPTKNEHAFTGDTAALDKQEIPSVKDLEAQMRKMDVRPECNISKSQVNAYQPQQTVHTEQRDNSVTRDTEAFKRLLQQLGSQSNTEPTYPKPSNIPAVRVVPRLQQQQLHQQPQPHQQQQHQQNHHQHHQQQQQHGNHQSKGDDIQLYQQHRPKTNDSLSHRHMDMMPQNQLHPNVHEFNISLQTHKRMEIQQLIQGVTRGDVSVEVLENELNNPNATPQSREIIAAVLFEFTNSGRSTLHQQQHQTYANEINCQTFVKNNQFFKKNVSPDDIYTNQNTTSQGLHQNPRFTNSPTPLAFTPTSVLRKMTADKETTASSTLNNSNIFNQQQQQHVQQFKLPAPAQPKLDNHRIVHNEAPAAPNQLQPRMILGGNYAMQHQMNINSPQISPKLPPPMSQKQNRWLPGNISISTTASHGTKSFGRPILKGTLNSGSQQMPAAFLLNSELQQHMHQQKIKSMQTTSSDTINNDSIHMGSTAHQMVPYNEGISSQLQKQQQPHYIQQQRVQPQPQPVSGHRLFDSTVQPVTMSSGGPDGNGDSSTNLMKNNLRPINNYHQRDERLSPTSNQLAQWFSPELLARASAGKLPLLNMNQALSLEEFERSMQHSSATVLN